ncbi:unnamed protein product, partial [marine sediment metagenome]
MELIMAKQRTGRKAGTQKDKTAYWELPWVKKVMQGQYSFYDKLLFMRMASFGVGGCWMDNETLADRLGCCERYVTEGIANLWDGGELWITGWNSSKRRIYAVRNPEVVAMATAWYQKECKAGKVTDKADFYRKMRSRGSTTWNDSTRLVEQECQVGGTIVPGNTEQECQVHISKSRVRIEEPELRRPDSSSPVNEQPNPPANEVE